MHKNNSDTVTLCAPDAAAMDAILAHFSAGQLPQAADAACTLINRWPDHGFSWKVLGAIRHLQGQTVEALTAMQHAVACLPNDVEARCNFGCVLQQAGHLPEAMVQYHAALALAPEYAMAWVGLADCYCALNQFGHSEAHARQALRYQPDHAETFALLGAVLQAQGKLDEAGQAYRRALSLDADVPTTQAGLAQVLMQHGALPEAVAHFRRALALRLQCNTAAAVPPVVPRFDLPDNEALLWRTLALLAQAGVHAFATAGTLLGLEREGTLLAFDKDMDFALPFSEMAAACACLLAHGWVEEPNPMRMVNPRNFRHRESGMVLDLCGIALEDGTGKVIGGFWQAGQPWAWQRITEFPSPLSLHQVRRPEGWIWALDSPLAWLETLYGDWRVPDPDFDTTIAAHNLRGFALLTQCYAFSRILERWQSGHFKKALAITRHSLRRLTDDVLLQQVAAHLEAVQVTTKSVQAV